MNYSMNKFHLQFICRKLELDLIDLVGELGVFCNT